MLKYFFLIVFILPFSSINAQNFQRVNYCQCEIVGEKVEISDNIKDTVYAVAERFSSDSLYVSFHNMTADTIYLFKSYFDEDISVSKYLYRYNGKEKKLNLSLIPLLPYLTTNYSDNVVLSDRVIKKNQVVYDFYKIPPYSAYNFTLLTRNFKSTNEFIRQFDATCLSKFDNEIKFKKERISAKENPAKFILQLAYYKNVKIICNEKSYYLNEHEFNNQAKKFITVDTEIPL